MSPKGRSSIFLIFCNKLDFQKAQRVLLSTILQTLHFLSLGYGADFRRSRLVIISREGTPSTNDIFFHEISMEKILRFSEN